MSLSIENSELLRSAFRPHAPIEDPSSFVGRGSELERVKSALSEPGLQVILIGERGCGKTSLANVASDGTEKISIFCEQNYNFAMLMQQIAIQYQQLHPARLVYDASTNKINMGGTAFSLNNLTGNGLLSLFPKNSNACIIFDELDRVINKTAVASLAELAKNAATNRSGMTFLMVGVAATANDLLAGHASNFRNFRTVMLDRMSYPDLRGIIARGERIIRILFQKPVIETIIRLCDQMPYYLHLLATNAARAALLRGAKEITQEHLLEGTSMAAANADSTLTALYNQAIFSSQGSHIYRRIVWSMAELSGNSNSPAEILSEVNKYAQAENSASVTVQAVGQALKQLSLPAKGGIVKSPYTGSYLFSSPLMKGFVRLTRHSSNDSQ